MNIRLVECCCCIPLRIGSVLILWLYLIAVFISSVVFLLKACDENASALTPLLILYSFAGIVCSLLGLYSVQEKKAMFLLGVCYHMLCTVFFISLYVVFCTLFPQDVFVLRHIPFAFSLLLLLFGTSVLGLLGYCAMVIKSYHNDLKTNMEQLYPIIE